ncbi:uncharacterized protein LOC120218915 [Hibiscus syriacus]|uniref:uncharacterized protein LOC120218915 n=1 Tax=Hibiscus syriacus TaxID=106335 RepID=UPI0019248780|nr:uncharacterized protein LOC120218915 [Hibiscus syriacus]
MAARASAELSSRGNISQQHSMESHMSSPHSMKDEDLQNNVARSSDKSTDSSFKSTASSFIEKASVNNETADAYSQINMPEGRQMEHFAELSINRNLGKNGMQFVNELHDIKNPRNIDHHEVRVGEQSSDSSSHSQPNTFTDDHDLVSNSNWQKSENETRDLDESGMQFENGLPDTKTRDDRDVVSNLNSQKSINYSDKDLFLPNDKGSLPRSTKETTDSFDNASAVFEDYGSDNYENLQNNSSPEKSTSKSQIFSEERTMPAFFESSTSFSVPSNVDDLPANFDDYGPYSESEEEVDKSKFVRSSNFSIGSGKQNTDSYKPENSSSLTPRLAEGIEDTEHSNEASLEESTELKFGNLTSGLRNKGYRYPSYSKFPRDNVFSYGEAASDTSTGMKQSSSPTAAEASINSGSYNQEPHSRKGNDEVSRKLGPKASVNQVDSSDDGSEEQPKDTSRSIEDHYNRTSIFEESKKSSSRGTVPYFDSGNSDSDEDLPKAISSESAVVFDHGEKKNLTSRSTDAYEALPKRQPQKKNSDNGESSQHSRLAPQPTSRLVSETKGSSVGGTLKSSEKEQQSSEKEQQSARLEGYNIW